MFRVIISLCKPIVRNFHVKSQAKESNLNHMYNRLSMQQKKRLKKFSPHFNAKLKVVGSGAPGTPACIYLVSDQVNYLFNCGEGTQRLSQEHHCKLSKLANIFLTHISWNNVGGLPGILLTAQDNGVEKINIHCPEGLDNFIQMVKTFIHLPNLEISYVYSNTSEPYQDHIMSVSYVPLTKSSKPVEDGFSDLTDVQRYSMNKNGKRIILNETEVKGEKEMKISPRVICYICKLHPRRGKLLMNKCIEFGIGPGPLLSLLKAGKDVIKNGIVVHSKDVCQSSSPETTFIVVDCPTEEYLDSFVNHPDFLKYQQVAESTEEQSEKVYCIFHFTPEEIFTTGQYQKWLEKFPPQTEHIILNDENICMGSEAVYKNQYILNMLHPEIFPLLSTDCIENDKKTKGNLHRARATQAIEVRPVTKEITNDEIHKEAKIYIDEIYKIPNMLTILKELRTNIDKKSLELNLSNSSAYPRIVMLGTGCSVPNKVRNTSGILIRISEDKSILLDCGEGTLGQIIRFYGRSESNKILSSIKGIFISHVHADHHLGLIGLLLKRKQVTEDVLYLLAPKTLIPWLNFYSNKFESIIKQYILVDNNDLYLKSHKLSTIVESTFYSELGIKEINTSFVTHCNQAFGIAIVLKNNEKIVYSGDTMFCRSLIDLGENCDLLIHEATMEDGLESVAKRKFHSTTTDAIKAGKFMNAKFTLLTHFSQRYSKIPSIPDNEQNVGIAYDNMELKLSQLPLLPLFYPAIKLMFNEYNKVIDSTN
ncbi:ribonuclease Z [Xylocopa sonorina]|uniref:ribonuclease Z n=1 Tax=Xylocopa sonorina TaxID=1818115 RepID=UPI00403AF603